MAHMALTFELNSHHHYNMVVVENPPTVDDKGKLISNMAVGVAEDLKS